MEQKNKKVFVGMSGGVDSSVCAYLLKQQGYEVVGVHLRCWNRDGCDEKEARDARIVADQIGIPFYVIDMEKEYKKQVVDYMIESYKIGLTPNPDVMCNKKIKFGTFLQKALDMGADYVATGHYAKLAEEDGEYFIYQGEDKNKDQSYFLWTLTQKQLKRTLFPIGDLQKLEVRKLAGKFGLPQATKKDSQGLCFLGKIDMKEFLTRYITPKKGKVLLAPYSFSGAGNEKEEVIGHHKGALFFTIGERHGFTITKKTTDDSPLYVISKNIKNNTITVAPKITPQPNSIQGQSLYLKDVNIIGKIPSKKIFCRIRYRQEKIGCRVEKKGNELKVIFDKLQAGISPGQSLVLYNNEICLGGGIIE